MTGLTTRQRMALRRLSWRRERAPPDHPDLAALAAIGAAVCVLGTGPRTAPREWRITAKGAEMLGFATDCPEPGVLGD